MTEETCERAWRRVEVTIGPPPFLEDAGVKSKEIPHPDECYFINFIEGHEEDGEEIADGFTAQSTCLCHLEGATKAWLRGDSDEEVQSLIEHEHPEDEDEE